MKFFPVPMPIYRKCRFSIHYFGQQQIMLQLNKIDLVLVFNIADSETKYCYDSKIYSGKEKAKEGRAKINNTQSDAILSEKVSKAAKHQKLFLDRI